MPGRRSKPYCVRWIKGVQATPRAREYRPGDAAADWTKVAVVMRSMMAISVIQLRHELTMVVQAIRR